jgi:hypothetical protein
MPSKSRRSGSACEWVILTNGNESLHYNIPDTQPLQHCDAGIELGQPSGSTQQKMGVKEESSLKIEPLQRQWRLSLSSSIENTPMSNMTFGREHSLLESDFR